MRRNPLWADEPVALDRLWRRSWFSVSALRLHDHAANVYSQHGEDGMIREILRWLDKKTGVAVEFGAWDGLKYSNTAKLWKDENWSAILIEADDDKYRELARNVSERRATAIHAKVGINPGTRLDDFVSADPDLIVIDIDGNDLTIFEDTELRPSLFVVEFNQTIPAWEEVWVEYAPDNRFGASLGMLARAAAKKGYLFIGASRTNGFFLRGDLGHKVPKDLDRSMQNLPNEKDLVYLLTTYDGAFVTEKDGPHGRTHYWDGALCASV